MLTESSPADSGTARGWTLRLYALAFAAATAVAVIYLPQTLLTNLAGDLGVPASAAGIVATAVQIGYAAGIFFLVPLSDSVPPRRQVTVQLVVMALAMLVVAAAPEVVSVTVAFVCVGLVANVAQLVIPAASRLAPVDRKGSTTGTLVGAVGVGIFGGRILAGSLVDTLGWRWVVVVFAAVVLATIPPARWALNADVTIAGGRSTYRLLLMSTVRRVRASPALLQSSVLQFLVFATFSSLWTVTVLHLTGPDYGWTVRQAGLFGAVGLAAALLTPVGARSIDRFGTARATTTALGVLLVTTAVTVFEAGNAYLFGVCMFLVTWANQTLQSANQHRVLTTSPDAPAQANTAFMVTVFLGGSVGALLGPLAFGGGGMPSVARQAVVLTCLACLAWALSLHHERRRGSRPAQDRPAAQPRVTARQRRPGAHSSRAADLRRS